MFSVLNCFMLPAMSCSRRRSCCNDPDSFCYILEYILKEYKRSLQILFAKYTVLSLELNFDQDKPRAQHAQSDLLSTYKF